MCKHVNFYEDRRPSCVDNSCVNNIIIVTRFDKSFNILIFLKL